MVHQLLFYRGTLVGHRRTLRRPDQPTVSKSWHPFADRWISIVDNRTDNATTANLGDNPKLHIVMVQPEIPQNTGNIARTCVAVEAKLWLVRPLGFRLDEHHMRRAGLDYWQHLQWQVVDSWSALQEQLPETTFWYFSRHARRSYTDVSYAVGAAFVFGSETQGLPKSICLPEHANVVQIPMPGRVRSLNVSNAVAVATFEALRQWGNG